MQGPNSEVGQGISNFGAVFADISAPSGDLKVDSAWDKVERHDSSDENVSKYVFTIEVGVGRRPAIAEAVLYKYPTYEERTVVCCSTQSGCPVGCRFCGTGDFFIRNLTAEEIVAQSDLLFKDRDIDTSEVKRLQIMFMSMGEPLLNMRELEKACEILYKKHPNAALLISTSAPKVNYEPIRELSARIPTIGLQFSVHESTDPARDALVPFKKKLTLKEIAVEGEAWFQATGRTPFFNYCAHPANVSEEDADRILNLFNPTIWQATISVICEQDESVSAANQRQRSLAADFQEKLLARGYSTRMFDPAGQDDIGGGCGQLWYVQDWAAKHEAVRRRSAGTGLPKVHTPMEK
ncbi:MAG: radical SAM protein [Bdellovibrionota bacterium]